MTNPIEYYSFSKDDVVNGFVVQAKTTYGYALGTLYPLMNRLKTDNLLESKWIEQETGIPRKYYFLTETGKQTLEEMKIQWSNLQIGINKII